MFYYIGGFYLKLCLHFVENRQINNFKEYIPTIFTQNGFIYMTHLYKLQFALQFAKFPKLITIIRLLLENIIEDLGNKLFYIF